MPDLTTKDALLERMVTATDKLATDVPAKFDQYLPLTGGTLSGNLTVSGSSKSLSIQNTSWTKGTAPSSATESNLFIGKDKNGTIFSRLSFFIGSDSSTSLRFTQVHHKDFVLTSYEQTKG